MYTKQTKTVVPMYLGWQIACDETEQSLIPLSYPLAPDTRAGGGAPEMESRLSTLATCVFGVRTSLEATTG